jgi:predicted RNase H-like HicB family nuclease
MEVPQHIDFVVHTDETGGYWAEAVGLSIFTQGETLDELQAMIRDVIDAYFFDSPKLPATFTMRLEDVPVNASDKAA